MDRRLAPHTSLVLVSLLALAAAPAPVAQAQGVTVGPQLPPEQQAPPQTGQATRGATATGGSPSGSPAYAEALGRGRTASSAGDRAGAITAFREAVQANPSQPEAVCHLAASQRLAGDVTAALDGFSACLRVARAANDARWTARALHGVASTLERIPERSAEARTAWQEYVRFADGNAQVAFAGVGRARITALDQMTEQERVMVEVRQRIAEREAARRQAASTPRP